MHACSYITGSSLLCSLGEGKREAVQKARSVIENGYERYVKQLFSQKAFYALPRRYGTRSQKFEHTLETVVKSALEEAGITPREQEELHIFIGSTSMNMGMNEECNASWLHKSGGREVFNIGYGYVGEYLQRFTGSRHTPLSFLTACTSSTNALIYAARMIEKKQIKKALVVGVELYNDTTYNGFSSLMLLSQKGVYRPFDADSDGIILGEGCSAMVLEERPKSDGDFAYLGAAMHSDTYSETTSNPDGISIFETMRDALEDAQLGLEQIDCIKAHATGSENNNLSEARGIDALFARHATRVPVTAVKPFIGHTLGASGSNEIVFMLECVKAGFLPPTLGFEKGIEGIGFTPMQSAAAIERGSFLFNFVGFGGSNSAVVLSNRER